MGVTSASGALLDDLAFRSDGTLFSSRNPNVLLTVDTVTGQSFAVGQMPLPLGNGNALAFDATDELYFANGFVLATIDPASAAVLTTTPLTFPPLGCFALWVEAMDPLPDGRFLASLTCDFSHSVLTTLDPETGVVSAGPATVSGVGGVAYRTCGNGTVDPGEECDDGNTEDGDCCDHACGAGIEGTPCADDGDGCTDDQCDATGVCRHPPNTAPCDDADPCTTGDTCSGGLCEGGSPVDCGACQACLSGVGCRAAPRTDCRLSMVGGRSKLLLSDGALSADRHRVRWSWRKGAATTLADLGDPRTGTDYALCVFDRTGGGDHLVLLARMPSGNAWRSARGGGFTFASPDAIPDGLRHVEVRSGSAGAARISVRGQGSNLGLHLPALGLRTPVTVQLQAVGGACFESGYDASVRANGGQQFRGTGD